MKECRLCKTANEDSVVFCRVCGTKFPDSIIQSAEEEPVEKNSNNFQFDISNDLKEIKALLEPKQYEYMAVEKWTLRERIEEEHKDEISDDYYKQSENEQVFLKYAIKYLNQLGAEGWELIIQDDTYTDCYLLKRECRNK